MELSVELDELWSALPCTFWLQWRSDGAILQTRQWEPRASQSATFPVNRVRVEVPCNVELRLYVEDTAQWRPFDDDVEDVGPQCDDGDLGTEGAALGHLSLKAHLTRARVLKRMWEASPFATAVIQVSEQDFLETAHSFGRRAPFSWDFDFVREAALAERAGACDVPGGRLKLKFALIVRVPAPDDAVLASQSLGPRARAHEVSYAVPGAVRMLGKSREALEQDIKNLSHTRLQLDIAAAAVEELTSTRQALVDETVSLENQLRAIERLTVTEEDVSLLLALPNGFQELLYLMAYADQRLIRVHQKMAATLGDWTRIQPELAAIRSLKERKDELRAARKDQKRAFIQARKQHEQLQALHETVRRQEAYIEGCEAQIEECAKWRKQALVHRAEMARMELEHSALKARVSDTYEEREKRAEELTSLTLQLAERTQERNRLARELAEIGLDDQARGADAASRGDVPEEVELLLFRIERAHNMARQLERRHEAASDEHARRVRQLKGELGVFDAD